MSPSCTLKSYLIVPRCRLHGYFSLPEVRGQPSTAVLPTRPDDEKLLALFAQLDQIPADLMFTHGPRIPRRPYRGAPIHLLEHKVNYAFVPHPNATRPLGQRTDRGLRVECKCFLLITKNQRAPDSPFIFFTSIPCDESATPLKTPDIPIEQQQSSYGMQLATNNTSRTLTWRESKTADLLAATEAPMCIHLVVGPECMHGPPPTESRERSACW